MFEPASAEWRTAVINYSGKNLIQSWPVVCPLRVIFWKNKWPIFRDEAEKEAPTDPRAHNSSGSQRRLVQTHARTLLLIVVRWSVCLSVCLTELFVLTYDPALRYVTVSGYRLTLHTLVFLETAELTGISYTDLSLRPGLRPEFRLERTFIERTLRFNL